MERLVTLFGQTEDVFNGEAIAHEIQTLKPSLKQVCISALQHNLPIPCLLSALDYLNTLQNNFASANIIQAQRDFFGAHQYKRKGDASGKSYHTVWE